MARLRLVGVRGPVGSMVGRVPIVESFGSCLGDGESTETCSKSEGGVREHLKNE
jgi:hypothetical protein